MLGGGHAVVVFCMAHSDTIGLQSTLIPGVSILY